MQGDEGTGTALPVRSIRVAGVLSVVLVVVGLWLLRRQVPPLADGSLCGGRVYSYGPGGGASYASGEVAPAARDAANARCRQAAAPLWWTGVAALLVAAALAVVWLWPRHRGSRMELSLKRYLRGRV
jgi:hypothetical protein